MKELAARGGEFGAKKMWVADDAALEAPLPQPRVDVLERLVRGNGYDTVLFGQSVLAADVASGLAARLEAGLNWDLTDLVNEGGTLVGKRPALQDSVIVDVGWKSAPRLALFRSGAFDPRQAGGEAEVEEVKVELTDFSTRATMVEQAHAESEGPSIEDADVIVAGGRGLGGPENFKLVEELAQALGGAVAATRAVVDAGWYPYAAQVGQTGKTVSPKLYVARRHLGRDPAQGRHAGLGHRRRDQQGRQRADLRVRRSRRRRRPARDPPEADGAREAAQVVTVRPADFPPPFDWREAIAEPSEPADERIDVGVLIVGAGPAGLACAIRLGQLLEDEPEVAERLGDVPFAVLEKGKQVGAHLLSGAVVNPRSLRTLFRERKRVAEMPFYGEVKLESVYYLTRHQAMRIPAPPTMKNHHNQVASLSRLGRWLGEEAEAAGATILPETAATKLLVEHGRVRGVRTGDKGRGRNGEPLAELRAGLRDRRARHRPLRGDAGPPHRRRAQALRARERQPAGVGARRQGGLEGGAPARPRDPHDGLAAAEQPALSRVRRFVHLSARRRHGHDRDGRRARLPRRRALGARPAPGVEDAPDRAAHPRGRGAHRVGSEDDSGRRLRRAAARAARAGALALRRRCRPRERAGAEGRPLCGRVRPARGRGGFRRRSARRVAGDGARLLRRALREGFIWSDLARCGTCARRSGTGSGSAARWPAR